MDIFPTQDPNAEANLISEQTKKMIAIRQAAAAQRAKYAESIGQGFGTGLAQGAEQGIQDHHVKAFLDQAYKQGRLAKGPDGQQITPDAAFQQYKAGFGSQGMMAAAPNPVQASQVDKNKAETDLAKARADALKNPKPKPAKEETPGQKLSWEKQWADMARKGNPAVAPRGSLLGLSGINNARADRALQTLNDPNMVVQQLDAVTSDIAGIMKGGTPDEQSMAHQSYGNILTRIAQLKSTLTSTPTAINNPATVKKLKQVVQDIKEVDNKVIKDNLDAMELEYEGAIKRDPERWKKLKAMWLKTTKGVTETQAETKARKPIQHMTDEELLKELGN